MLGSNTHYSEKSYLCSNTGLRTREVTSETVLYLMRRYIVLKTFHNDHGQVIWFKSLNGERVHSILITNKEL